LKLRTRSSEKIISNFRENISEVEAQNSESREKRLEVSRKKLGVPRKIA
jgi:hypothetical protein